MSEQSLFDQLDQLEMEDAFRQNRQPRLVCRPEHDQQIADAMESLGVLPDYHDECGAAIRSTSHVNQQGQITDDLKTDLPAIVKHVVVQQEKQNVFWAAPTSPALRSHVIRDVKSYGDLFTNPKYSKTTLHIAFVQDRGLNAFTALHADWGKPENALARKALDAKLAARKHADKQKAGAELKKEIVRLKAAHAPKAGAER